ncbi:hypothetical protein K450DRAFT_250522 [Umbelopsis ramanniana AG]|uniref:Cyclin N-terminal domain-containing protein n=1 Tax=Umbelopsis ramanniana AG TaxID=1314678 RepID=A0AAD5E582_UMBRA|nr:uncharacterized protein K450DRAFT_250522 [Umbelopsis ramanniana AG]KAI8577723.1 hypothetical protein K450DRAFT_250522 [Umbelopsis ramanniana AG]
MNMYTEYQTPRNKAIQQLLRQPVTEEMIDYVTWKATTVIPCTIPSPPQSSSDLHTWSDTNVDMQGMSSSEPLATPPLNAPTDHTYDASSAPPPLPGQVAVPPLREFITNLVRKSGLHTGTFLATLVYLDRLRQSLYTVAKGMPCTCHRVFLSTLIITAKYVNDTSPKNRHWARYSSVFSVAEVNLMEKQLLVLLDFHLSITMDEFVKNIAYFLTPEETQTPVSQQRYSYPPNPVAPLSKPHQSHRFSSHSEPDPGNLVRNYLTNSTDGYPMGYASAAVTPKFSDSAYSSDDYQEEPLNKSAPNLKALDNLIPPPPPSYMPQHQAHVHFEETLLPHYNSKNPYRTKYEMDPKRRFVSEAAPPNTRESIMLSVTNQPNSTTRDSRSRR